MKRLFNPYIALMSIIFITAMLLFSSCKKNNDTVNTPVAALMAFNLATDKAAVDIAIGGTRLTNVPLNYGNFTGAYVNIYPGQREIAAYDNSSSASFATATGAFEVNNYYSVFILGDSSMHRNIIVHDQLDSLKPTADKAFIRYVNAIPDSSAPAVTVSSGGTEVINKTASFATVSDFATINAGDIAIAVSNGTTISATRNITVEKNKVYTILLQGKPGAGNTERQVQVKFIVNGIVN